MKIKLIDFGVPEHQRPYRPHGNDAGADVYLPHDCTLPVSYTHLDVYKRQMHDWIYLPSA